MRKIIFASKNKGKVMEVSYILKNENIEILSLLGVEAAPEIIENGSSFEENARIKAKVIFDAFRIPVIGDDSGLSVEQLGGRPGVYSARYSGNNATDEDNNQKLLIELNQYPEPHYAKFICCAVFFDGKKWLTANGEIKGRIIKHPRGENGFGYDPLFLPDGFNKTAGELSLDEKNKISHRAIAFNKLKGMIINYWSEHEK
jgi:XTP/dITP diphosphohydrolase